jgi:predicted nucleic acid-binding protein
VEQGARKVRALSRAGLSFTDCTSIATIENLGLEAIALFDRGFDGVVARIE